MSRLPDLPPAKPSLPLYFGFLGQTRALTTRREGPEPRPWRARPPDKGATQAGKAGAGGLDRGPWPHSPEAWPGGTTTGPRRVVSGHLSWVPWAQDALPPAHTSAVAGAPTTPGPALPVQGPAPVSTHLPLPGLPSSLAVQTQTASACRESEEGGVRERRSSTLEPWSAPLLQVKQLWCPSTHPMAHSRGTLTCANSPLSLGLLSLP